MAEPKESPLMERIVALCKRRGFIYQSSEIYGGINGFWDYGPLGAELKRNLRDAWWQAMMREREDVVGLDATIIMHPKVWKASGHVDTFSDPMVDCLASGKRFRADQVEPLSGVLFKFQGASETALALKKLEEASAAAPEVRKLWETSGSHHLSFWTFIQELKAHSSPLIVSVGEQLASAMMSNPSAEPFEVLVPESAKSPERHAFAVAGRFYERRGMKRPEPILAGKGDVVTNTVQYNSEPGACFGGKLTPPRPFNLMFQTYVGASDPAEVAYLRPETAQAIFVQFKNVVDSSRVKVPFGICQIGKAFRNEVTPRNFTFRSREFEQMELEFFIRPDEVVEKLAGSVAKLDESNPQSAIRNPQSNWGWELWHRYWVDERVRWYESIGLPRESLHLRHQGKEELAHYAKATCDIEFDFPFGTQELEGIAARGDFDLKQHQEHSGKSMEYFDEEAKAKYLPHVIEPSAGVDRLVLALICHAYTEDEVPDEKGKLEKRVVMKFHPRIAPIKVGVFPLLKNRPELVAKAREVRDLLRPHMTVFYDEAGAIGRRYRRQDEAGTPFGVTIDFDTLGETPELKDTVTLRDRDTCKQIRVKIDELVPLLQEKLRA